MNTKPNCQFVSSLITKPLFFAAIIFPIIQSGSAELHAQGRLGGISRAVRKDSAKPASPKPSPPRNSSPQAEPPKKSGLPRRDPPKKSSPPNQSPTKPERDHDDDHRSNGHHDNHGSHKTRYRQPSTHRRQNNHRHNSSHRQGSRSSGIIFVAPHVTHAQPVVIPVVPAYPPMHPQPAIVEPFIEQPQPGMGSVMIAQPNFEAANQPVYESVASLPVNEIYPVEQVVEHVVLEDWFQNQASTLWATIGSDFDGITSGGLGARLQAPGSFGLESSVMTLRESVDGYRNHLWIGDVNLTYEILNRQNVRGRVGLGVNWLNDAWGGEAGFNLTGGIDLRLTDRVTLALEGDVGNLGDADFFHARVNAARRFENVELMLGVDHFNIGGTEVNSVFTGMQLRF